MNFAIIFPGQGSQYTGMGKIYYDNYPVAREIFDDANEALGFDLKELCFNGEMDKLSLTQNAQPAILTVSFIAFKVFMEKYQMAPKYLAGHSLGEYTALACSGALQFKDAVKIVNKRGIYMQEAMNNNTGKMIAVRCKDIDNDYILKECESIKDSYGFAVVSNYNSPQETVISGDKKAVDIIGEKLRNSGFKTVFLNVSAPFHSPLMKPAAEKLEETLLEYTLKEPSWPILSNVTALPYQYDDDIVYKLVKQMTSPVRWVDSMAYLNNQDIGFVVECGPRKILKKLMLENCPEINTFSYDEKGDMDKLDSFIESSLKKRKQNFITKCIAIAICTKNCNFDEYEYQKGFVEPYRAIKVLEKEIRDNDLEPSLNQIKEALKMLVSTFKTKLTSENEQLIRYKQLFEETGMKRFILEDDLPRILIS